MFDVSKIEGSLIGLIGYKQPYNPDYAVLDAQNLLSESGYFINSNPYAKIEYIKDCQDYKDISDDNFNNFLRDLKKTSITNITNQVFNEPSYIDRNLIYKNALNKVETDNLPNGFIGYKIQVSSEKSIAFKISRVFLDFDGVGTFDLLLFNTSKKTPIKIQNLVVSSDHDEYELNWVINDTESIYKGDYYIGYIKDDDTSMKPYKRNYESSNIISYITHLNIRKIKVDGVTNQEIFDLNDVESLEESTGLNFDITVYDDFTDLIIQNRFLFARAIYLNSVISCLNLYMASLRSSRNEKLSADIYNKVLVEIEGTKSTDNVISVKGLRSEMLTEISTIKSEVKKLRDGYLNTGFITVTQC